MPEHQGVDMLQDQPISLNQTKICPNDQTLYIFFFFF